MKRKYFRVLLSVVLALSLCMVMTVPVSAASITDVSATPTNDMAGATTTYPIGFTTITTYVIDSVEIEFASGFDVSAAALSGTPGNIGAGTVSSSGQVVTYTVTSPALLGAVAVTISLSGIVNAAAATYTPGVTIRTKSGVATIDSGSVAVTIVSAPVSFKVETENALSQTAGTAFWVKVTAMSLAAGAGSTVTGYIDDHLIDFSSTASDPKILPAFAVIDFTSGEGTLTGVVFNVVETGKTITATDSVISVTGTSGDITVGPGAAHHLTITGAPASVTAGVAFSSDVIVTAYDASGNVRTAETEVVNWTSSDGTATAGTGLPADSTNLLNGTFAFTAADFILKTVGAVAVAGAQTITATGGTSSLSATATVTVNPAAASTLTVAAATDPIAADGVASSVITATAKDAFTNTDTNYAGSVTFATSLGTLSGVSANFVSGVATATLTSTTTGTATILVSSGTLTDVTTTVTLTAAPIEVWVKATTGNDSNPGTEALPFLSIATGIAAVGVNGTVNVGTGTYTPGSTLTIATAGLTLQSTGTTAATITAPAAGAIRITADDVTVDGFTIIDSSGTETAWGILCAGADDAIVQNNVVNFTTSMKTGIDTGIGTGVKVTGNVLNEYAAIILHGSDAVISGNTFGHVLNFWALVGATPLHGVTITGNTFPANANANFAILIRGESGAGATTINDTLIENNTITGRKNGGILIAYDSSSLLTVTNLTVTGNRITNSTKGIDIHADVVWGAGNTINNNNIVGNAVLGIDNADTIAIIDAQNNWWGDPSGPYHATTNPTGTGDAVDTEVDYRPWLAAPYAMPADPVTSISISLVTGWNLISLPIMPTSSAIATVLADLITDLTVDEVRTYDQGWYNWASTGPAGNLTIMEDGSGYWIDMIAADTLVVAGSELPAPPATPPSYSVYTGWNMIGFKSVDTDTTVAAYLGSLVAGTLEAIYGYDAAAGAYFIPGVTIGHLKLEPGCGYWLAVNDDGTIYP